MKRFLSVLLSFMLVVTLLPPLQALANENIEFDEYGIKTNVDKKKLAGLGEESKSILASDAWASFPSKTQVVLNHEWKINFSAIATADKIDAIVIEKNNVQIPVNVIYDKSKVIKVKAIENFEENQKYVLKIILINGKKYKMDFTTLKENPVDKALREAQEAVYALPALMDVMEKDLPRIKNAEELVTIIVIEAKKLGAYTAKVEAEVKALEAILAELRDAAAPPVIKSAEVIGTSTIKVTFDKAVDASVALFTVANHTVRKVTFNASKTSTIVELAGVLNSGTISLEQTISVSGIATNDLTTKVTAEAERVEAIEILSDKLIRNGEDLIVGYKVENQYGEDITETTTTDIDVKVNLPGSIATATKGTVKIPIPTGTTVKEKDEFDLRLTSTSSSDVYAEGKLTVSTEPTLAGIKINQKLYNKDNKKLAETTDLETDKFYLLIEATDQYGNPIVDEEILNVENAIRPILGNPELVEVSREFVDVPNKGIGLRLTGTPKAGKTTITVTATNTVTGINPKGTIDITVAESTRTDKIEIGDPSKAAVAKEELFIPIEAWDKEGHPIEANRENPTRLEIFKDPVSGITHKFTPFLPAKIAVEDGKIGLKIEAEDVKAGDYTLNVTSSTGIPATKQIKIEPEATPATWVWNDEGPIKTEINIDKCPPNKNKCLPEEEKENHLVTQDINELVTVKDNLDRVVTDGKYTLVVTSEPSIPGTVPAIEIEGTKIHARAVGTSEVTIGIKKGTEVVGKQAITFKVTDNTKFIRYEVQQIDTIYDAGAAGKGQHDDYNREVIIIGVLEGGGRDRVPKDNYTISDSDYLSISDAGKLKIIGDTNIIYGSSGVDKRPIEITIKSSGEVHKPEVTFSEVPPKVVEIQNSQQTIPYDPTIAGVGPFDFDKLLGLANVTDITATDQYGVKSEKLSNHQFVFPDGTNVDSNLKFTTVTGGHLFVNNDTKDAEVTDFSAKSSFNAFITVGNITSKNPVKLTVEEAYMPTVEAELKKITEHKWGRLDNHDDVLKMAQGLVGDGYTVSIKSSDNIAISTSGNVTQQGKIARPNVVFSVKNTTKPLLNIGEEIELTVSAATEVILAAGSVETAIAGNAKITGLKKGTKYVVTEGTKYHGVSENGTLNEAGRTIKAEAEVLAEALNGTEITGLKNGTSYKVEVAKIADTGISGKSVQTTAGIAPTEIIPAYPGVYTVTFDGSGSSVTGDTVIIDTVVLEIVTGGDATATALEVKELAEANAPLMDKYEFEVDHGELTITQKNKSESPTAVTVVATITDTDLTVGNVLTQKSGVEAVPATPGTAEVNTFTITGPAKAAGNVTVRFNDGDTSIVKEIRVAKGETAELVAAKVTTAFANNTTGWTVSNNADTVVFTANPIVADKIVTITLANS